MVGNMIYLLFRKGIKKRELTLIAPHATFDGIKNHLQEIEDYCENEVVLFRKFKNNL